MANIELIIKLQFRRAKYFFFPFQAGLFGFVFFFFFFHKFELHLEAKKSRQNRSIIRMKRSQNENVGGDNGHKGRFGRMKISYSYNKIRIIFFAFHFS